MQTAGGLGLGLQEQAIEVEALVESIRVGEDIELFGCGTGAVVASVQAIGDETGLRLQLPDARTAPLLRQHLLEMQHGLKEAPLAWQWPVGRGEMA